MSVPLPDAKNPSLTSNINTSTPDDTVSPLLALTVYWNVAGPDVNLSESPIAKLSSSAVSLVNVELNLEIFRILISSSTS